MAQTGAEAVTSPQRIAVRRGARRLLPGSAHRTEESSRPVEAAMGALARRLGCTVGQAYTSVIGLVIATALAITAISPRPHTREDPASPSVSQSTVTQGAVPAPTDEPSPTPSPLAPGHVGFPTDGGAASDPGLGSGGARETDLTLVLPEVARFAAVPAPGVPEGVAVDSDGRVYVATNNGGSRGGPGPSRVCASRLTEHPTASTS